jgi:DNA-binding response OmpR family regulator
MPDRLIRTLHVEDDQAQRRYVAHHLAAMPDYRFELRYADTEDQAVAEFQSSPADLVLLDYQLARGDGLSCLIRLRRSDPLVPIIAISGAASAEITAELLQAGADEYIPKEDLSGQVLRDNLRPLLARTIACRERIDGSRPGPVDGDGA